MIFINERFIFKKAVRILIETSFSLFCTFAITSFQEEQVTKYLISFSLFLFYVDITCQSIMLINYLSIYGRQYSTEIGLELWEKSFRIFWFNRIIYVLFSLNNLVTSSYAILSKIRIEDMYIRTILLYMFSSSLIKVACSLFVLFLFLLFKIQKESRPSIQMQIRFERSTPPLETECAICLEDDKEKEWVELRCKHFFHIDCIVPWVRIHNNCPICRNSI